MSHRQTTFHRPPCACGERSTPGVVHRTNAPCYVKLSPAEVNARLKAEHLPEFAAHLNGRD